MISVISVMVPMVGMIVLVWVLARIIVSPARASRTARPVDGQLEFAPNRKNFVATPMFVAFLVYLGVTMYESKMPSGISMFGTGFWLVLAAVILTAFPATILANDEGLKQVYWFWKPRRIAWKDISAVTFDEKKQKLTIKGQGGTKIVHTRQLPDRARLIAEIEKHSDGKVPVEVSSTVATAVTA
jgi:hypothetical protein